MTVTLELLNKPLQDMQRNILNGLLVPGVDGTDLILGSPKAAQNRDLSFSVTVPDHLLDDPVWRYLGSVDLYYTRIDLANFFAGIDLYFDVPEGSTTKWLADKLSAIFKVRFEASDYVREPLPLSSSYTTFSFRAAASSGRWRGQVSIRLRLEQGE